MSASARAAAPLAVLLLGVPARGEPPVIEDARGHTVARVSLETSGYHDTDHVDVITPTLAAGLTDPVGGWSLEGSYLVDAVSAASGDIVSSATPHWTERRHVGA